MASQKKESHLFAWITGLSVGTAVGAALGVAWYLGRQRKQQDGGETPRRPKPAPAPRFTLTRAQLPKKHFKFLITKDQQLSEEFKEYLTQIFNLADSAQDGGLSEDDMQNLVLLVRNEPLEVAQLEWYFETFETNSQGKLTLEGFLRSYVWPLSSTLPLEQVAHSYQEEMQGFGCTCDHWIEQ